jgi:hypothetical protein
VWRNAQSAFAKILGAELGPSADVFRLSTPAGMIMIHGTATTKVPRLSGKASAHRYCSLIHLIPPLRLLYTFPGKGRGPHRLASVYIPSGSSIKSSRPASRFGGTIANRLCMLWGSHCPRLIPGDNFEAKNVDVLCNLIPGLQALLAVLSECPFRSCSWTIADLCGVMQGSGHPAHHQQVSSQAGWKFWVYKADA